MKELQVKCPECESSCCIDLDPGDLAEGSTTTLEDIFCDSCRSTFTCDVYVDVMNKKRV